MLAGLTQRGGEALVLGDRLGELALRLEQPLLEGPHALGCVLEPAPEDDDLFLERLQLVLEIADLAFVLGEASLVLRSHEDPPSSRDSGVSAGRSNLHLGTLITDDAPDVHFPRRALDKLPREHAYLTIPRPSLSVANSRFRDRPDREHPTKR